MSSHISTRRRRSDTPAFRLQVIAEARRPGASVAEVARQHDLNTNVVFHWLRDPRYVFRGRLGDLIKITWWDGQGACLLCKRLEKGRFAWPSPAEGKVGVNQA